jgi:hypothetical protein
VKGKFPFSLRILLLAILAVGVVLAVAVPVYRWAQVFSTPVAPIAELDQIVARCAPAVDVVESFRTAYGRYPESLEEAGFTRPLMNQGSLQYQTWTPNVERRPGYELYIYLARYDTYLWGDQAGWWTRGRVPEHRWTPQEAKQIVLIEP